MNTPQTWQDLTTACSNMVAAFPYDPAIARECDGKVPALLARHGVARHGVGRPEELVPANVSRSVSRSMNRLRGDAMDLLMEYHLV